MDIDKLREQVDQVPDLTPQAIQGLMIELLKARLENAQKGHRLAVRAHRRAARWGPPVDLALGLLNGAAAVWNIAAGTYPMLALFNIGVGAWCMWAWTQRKKKLAFWEEAHEGWHTVLAEIVTDGERIAKSMGISKDRFDEMVAERRAKTNGTSDV